MRRKWNKWIRHIIGGMTLLLLLAACGGGARDGRVLNVAREIPSDTINNLTNNLVNNAQIIANFSEGLVTYDNEGQLIPGLAESWKHEDNVYTFKLRDNLKWSDGTPLTAADFVFGWRTIATMPEAPYSYFMEDVQNGAAVTAGTKPVTELGVKALDETTLEVTLGQDRVYTLDILAHTTFFPLNEAFYTRVGADNYGTTTDTVLASGPFMLSEYNPSIEYTLVKNPEYWDAEHVELDTIHTRIIKESATQDTLYENDELDVLEVTASLYDKYADNPGLVEMQYDRLYYFYLSASTGTSAPTLANADFRRAIAHAIDKEVLATNVLKDGSKPLDHLVPNGFGDVQGKPFRTFVNGDNIEPKFDAAKAQAYLAKAKESLSDDALSLHITYQDKEENRRVFENVQAQLQEHLPGVKVTIESLPGQTYFQEILKGQTPAAYSGWTPAYNDASTYFQVFLSNNGLNFSRHKDPVYDKLYEEAQNELDPVKRATLLHEAEKLLIDEGLVIPLAQRGKRYVVKDNIKGFNFNSTYPEMNFRYMRIE